MRFKFGFNLFLNILHVWGFLLFYIFFKVNSGVFLYNKVATLAYSTVHMAEWEVTRQLSVRVTRLFHLIFPLMYLHKIVCQNFWTPCDVHFEKQIRVHNDNQTFGQGLGLQ